MIRASLAGVVLLGLAACSNPQARAQSAAYGYVKTQLKAPATAKFSGPRVTCNEAADICYVSGNVDAQNGFGALLRNRFQSTVIRQADGSYADGGTFLISE